MSCSESDFFPRFRLFSPNGNPQQNKGTTRHHCNICSEDPAGCTLSSSIQGHIQAGRPFLILDTQHPPAIRHLFDATLATRSLFS